MSYSIARRTQAVILRGLGLTLAEIATITLISAVHIRNLYLKATNNGWRNGTAIDNHHVENCKRTGRPKIIDTALEEDIINAVTL